MKRSLLALSVFLGLALNMSAQVTDIEGNIYSTVTIGSQTWMQENLKTTKYRNGDDIGTTIPPTLDISGEIEPKYQWPAYADENYVNTYGRLYTWYAALDERGLCPSGWHLPSDAEWTALTDYLTNNGYGYEGSGDDIAKSMAASSGWNTDPTPGNVGNDQAGNNSSGFSALPSGSVQLGNFNLEYMGGTSYWWTSTTPSYSPNAAHMRLMASSQNRINSALAFNKPSGMSVRCIQDTEIADEFSLDVQDVTADEGQALEVTISVSELTAADHIISYQFDIEFDNSALEYTGNDITGTLAEGGTITVNTDVPGRLSFSYMHTTALVGTGNILRLQFNSLATDTSEVSISNAYLNNTVVDDLTNGTVIVRDITPPTAAINYNDTDIRPGDNLEITATFSEPILASNAVHMNLSGAAHLVDAEMTRQSETVYTYLYSVPNTNGVVTVNVSHGTDLWNNEVVPVPSSGESFTVAGLTPGDVDDDGNVLAYDAALTLQHSVGIDPLPAMDPLPWENWRVLTADVDGTAGITAHDAGMILQYSAGIITDFSGGGKKSAPQANISMEFLEEEIIFYAYGTLLGLNVSVENDFHILGEPIILAEDFLSALNISQSVYRFGICTSNPPANGEAILKIPFDGTGSVNINMIINDVSKTLPLNLTTGIPGFDVNEISIYPNPVADNLNISGINGETTARIYSINGQLMHTSILINSVSEINVSELPGGLYVIKVETDAETTVKRFIKR